MRASSVFKVWVSSLTIIPCVLDVLVSRPARAAPTPQECESFRAAPAPVQFAQLRDYFECFVALEKQSAEKNAEERLELFKILAAGIFASADRYQKRLISEEQYNMQVATLISEYSKADEIFSKRDAGAVILSLMSMAALQAVRSSQPQQPQGQQSPN